MQPVISCYSSKKCTKKPSLTEVKWFAEVTLFVHAMEFRKLLECVQIIANARGKYYRGKNPSYIVDENAHWYKHCENQYGDYSKN